MRVPLSLLIAKAIRELELELRRNTPMVPAVMTEAIIGGSYHQITLRSVMSKICDSKSPARA